MELKESVDFTCIGENIKCPGHNSSSSSLAIAPASARDIQPIPFQARIYQTVIHITQLCKVKEDDYRVHLPRRTLQLRGQRGGQFLDVEEAEEEVDNHRQNKGNTQEGGPQTIIKVPLSPPTNRLCTPVVGHQGVDHAAESDKGEEEGTYAADFVAEVKKANGKTAQDNGEIQP